ncbi:erythromycin esterase family protein [Allokutzneria sp. NRRL B-24872]|uniref:erythromycin esterase family protein n=1 Tax=Allokutzneria sp. NRRL B-24872 TaxID=1137961 RepID=UPI000A3A3F59|nr:erythromycin esterase family protein [Allokutzneria sp. NRRL B-24872]
MRAHIVKMIAAIALGAVLAGCGADSANESVTEWLDSRSTPLRGTDPRESVEELAALGKTVGSAEIVGLGEHAHGLAEITRLKHRAARYLVEELGFRTIAWEEDWSLGTQIDDYVHGRRHDRDALIGQMSSGWRFKEIAEFVDWIRDYNRTHQDKVRFFGVEYYATRPFVYDDIEAHIARHAPSSLATARTYLAALKPKSDDIGKHLRWYMAQIDKKPYVRQAEQLYDLVRGLPQGDAVAEHGARQIRSFYSAFVDLAKTPAFRDARAAENLSWLRKNDTGKIVYWAASAHTADLPALTISQPQGPPVSFASVGSFLRKEFRYLSVGFTYHHGTYGAAQGVIDLPRPPAEWFEHELGKARGDQYVVDLRGPASPAVRAWLDAPRHARGYPEAGLASTMSGGTPAQWFDVIVHRAEVSPATPLTK